MRSRIEIDLNSQNPEGLTLARLADASGELTTGQIVTAYESEDKLQALAYVHKIDVSTGYAFLVVNWDSMRDDDGVEVQAFGSAASRSVTNRAYARTQNVRAHSRGRASAADYAYQVRIPSR